MDGKGLLMAGDGKEAQAGDGKEVKQGSGFFCPPKSRWRNFSSRFPCPFPSVTPALFDRLRSSGGELRRAPLSVNPCD
jgi:hypothetical protein